MDGAYRYERIGNNVRLYKKETGLMKVTVKKIDRHFLCLTIFTYR